MEQNWNDSSNTELLAQILEDQKKLLRRATILFGITIVLFLAVMISLGILVPRAAGTLDHMEASLQEVDVLIADAGEVINGANDVLLKNTDAITEAVAKINAVDFEGLNEGINTLVSDADGLLADNTEAVNEAINKINNVDFERLNEAINDLADVVEPLARFVNRFNGNS